MFILYISIILFVNIAPVTMQSITVEIENIESLITSSLDRLLGVIDPTIDKFQNTTIEILSVLEDRIKINTSEILYWFETNLFILLFVAIVFFIFIFKLLDLLDTLLVRYTFTLTQRRFAALAVITIISVWLFIAMILSAWPPTNKFDLQTLKYVSFGLLCILVLSLIGIWMFSLHTHRNHIKQFCTSGSKKRIFTQGKSANMELETVTDTY
jgi:hypothetical protein